MNKIALTIDIEDWYHSPAVTGSNFSKYSSVKDFMSDWNGEYDFLSKPTMEILVLLNELDIKATFFIVANVSDYYPGLIEKIVEYGHEVACHGFDHSININSSDKKPAFSLMEFEQRTGKARDILKNITGQEIIGYRAPGAFIGNWMFDVLIKLGFKYDSSVNPNSFFNKTDFDTGQIQSVPYFHTCSNGNKILEIPWPYWKVGRIKFPTPGGPIMRFLPCSYTIRGLKNSLVRGDTMFYLHPIDISESPLPSLGSKNIRRPFFYNTSGAKTKKKLIQILRNFIDDWVICRDIVNKY